MAKSNNTDTDAKDPSLETIQAIEQVDLKALSYTQLRRLLATVTQALADLNEELTLRAEDDNAGDTVKIPVSEAAD